MTGIFSNGQAAAQLLRKDLKDPDGGFGADMVANASRNVASVAALLALGTPAAFSSRNYSVTLLGYYAVGDKGGGVLDWIATDARTADNAYIFNPSGNVGAGRWIRRGDTLSLRQAGLVAGTGADQKALLQNAWDVAALYDLELIDQGGTYDIVNTTPLTIPSNLWFHGNRFKTILRVSNPLAQLAEGTGVSNTTLEGHTVTATGAPNPSAVRAYNLAASSDCKISIRALNYKNVIFTSSAANYAAVTALNMCHRMNADNNECIYPDATPADQTIPPIFIAYTDGFQVIGGNYKNSGHGVVWWGGDSNFSADGAITNERKCRNGRIEGVNVETCAAAAIWGSMGENITVVGNTVKDASDVTLDAEGCFNVVFSANTVKQTFANNGVFSVFFGSRDVKFIGNSVSMVGGVAYRNYNTSQNPLFSIGTDLSNNTIRVTSGTATIDAGAGAAHNFTVHSNKMTNVLVDLQPNNMGSSSVNLNDIVIDFTTIPGGPALTFINLSTYFLNESPLIVTEARVQKNQITRRGSVPAGCVGIQMTHVNGNSNGQYYVVGNTISEVSTHVRTSNASANVPGTFVVSDNIMRGTPNIERLETGAQISNVLLINNKTGSGLPYPGALPTVGTWDRGQLIEIAGPEAGQPSRYRNVTKGTFGTGTPPNFRVETVLL